MPVSGERGHQVGEQLGDSPSRVWVRDATSAELCCYCGWCPAGNWCCRNKRPGTGSRMRVGGGGCVREGVSGCVSDSLRG